MIRAVLDPGVLIAALISPRGAPARLLALWIEGAFELITSPRLLDELRAVLLRQKFRRYVSNEEVGQYLDTFERLSVVVRDPTKVPRASHDPKDDYLVALAIATSATLVSGDPHLTELGQDEPRVLTPREFVDSLS
jgi:putative PIN family toxin of toxin-antitoxin system